MAFPAAFTAVDILLRGFEDHLREAQLRLSSLLRLPQSLSNQRQLLLFYSCTEQAIMPDLYKALRQNMLLKAGEELLYRQTHDPLNVPGSPVTVAEDHLPIG